jgi:hypothetical protein
LGGILDRSSPLFIYGLPAGAIAVELAMRWIIKRKCPEFDEFCYGADLGLAAVTTIIAFLVDIKPQHMTAASLVLIGVLFLWFASIIIHIEFEGELESLSSWQKRRAQIVLGIGGNVVGGFALVIVLRLIGMN